MILSNYQYNQPKQYTQKWSNVSSEKELKVLKQVYEELQKQQKTPSDLARKRREVFQKYTNIRPEIKTSVSTKIDQRLIVRPKTSIEFAKDLGNFYSKNNVRWRKTTPRPTTSPFTHSAFKLGQDFGNAYSRLNRTLFKRSSKEINDQKRSKEKRETILDIARKYGDEWGRKVNADSVSIWSHSNRRKSSLNKDLTGLAKTEIRKDYGNYCSLKNRMRLLEEFGEQFHMNHTLRHEYERTQEKMSELEMKYKSSGSLDGVADQIEELETKSNEKSLSTLPKETEMEMARIDYGSKDDVTDPINDEHCESIEKSSIFRFFFF